MPLFQAAPKPTQADIEFVIKRVRERILRYLKMRGVLTFAAAPGDDEVNTIFGEGFGESDPAHSTLLNAATSGSPPAGPAQKRVPLANERLHLLTDGRVTVEFKRPWSDGMRSIGLAPEALISRMAAPPKGHVAS